MDPNMSGDQSGDSQTLRYSPVATFAISMDGSQ